MQNKTKESKRRCGMETVIAALISGIACLACGFALGVVYRKKVGEAEIGSAEIQARKILEDGIRSAENKKKEGVVALPSGLQYKILTAGNGPKPKASDTVKCHYEGRLINGTVFDSSIRRNEPAEFPVSGVIAGWVEALQLMPVGSKWQLYIPSELAYGTHGAGQSIGPNQTLIFDVELLAII